MAEQQAPITAPIRRGPLDGRAPVTADGVSLTLPAFAGKLVLRGGSDDGAFTAAAAKVLGAGLPLAPNTAARGPRGLALWLGPTEWMVHVDADTCDALAAELTAAFAGLHAAVVDVSDYYAVMRLGGPRARDVLAKGCPLDLHPDRFDVDHCAQTRFVASAILLHQVDVGPTYDIQVRWSFADFLWTYLADAMREFTSR
ncbi:MAG: sarcosine oxidase subunit gamma [Hyphomicrobiales bacterium]|nr:sarcosine oxidase subunit gamma [Hyphomicrobiales bacterium]